VSEARGTGVGTGVGAGPDPAAAPRIVSVESSAPGDWDARTVDAPGGNVHQGSAWAEHRARQGWRPRFVTFDDGAGVLVLTRRQRLLPGVLAYAPRGPVSAGADARIVAQRVVALAAHLRREGAVVLAADPELDASPAYEQRLADAGFRPIEELQAERHRMVLSWSPGTTKDELLAGVAKSTRQRIRSAERAGTEVEATDHPAAVDRFADLYTATARRRSFWIGDVDAAAAWWRRAIGVGQARLLVARHGGRIVGGLLLYRQGGRFATAYSADDATTRRELPGTMHLLRWTAIRDAIDAGDPAIDLGGVDVPGARRIPRPGEPTYGLYEHKRSFGAEWVECAPAHEIVLRPWIHGSRDLVRRIRTLTAPGARKPPR
jgi:lipid II:glycine glycyltransferase (peptidoglycan interpeptide bridge formation enzyme)